MKPIIRYVVEHEHKAYNSTPVENAVVSYSTDLDVGSVSSLSMAIHTACRYNGIVYSDDGVEKKIVKDYKTPQKKQ